MTPAPRPPVNTPGPLGYLLGVAVSIPAYGVLMAVGSGGGPMDALVAGILVSTFGLPWTLAVAVPGAVVVHLVCRRVVHQGVHVAVAAGCGVVGGALVWTVLGDAGLLDPRVLTVGLAAALGRTAVIPLVDCRRAAVERDFVATT